MCDRTDFGIVVTYSHCRDYGNLVPIGGGPMTVEDHRKLRDWLAARAKERGFYNRPRPTSGEGGNP